MKEVTDISNPALNVIFLSPQLSYAAIVDSDDNEVEITQEMIVEACDSLDEDQVYPFARTAAR